MCGIAGIARRSACGVDPLVLARMAASVRHRGPDGWGLWRDEHVGLAHVRLRIVDLVSGAQPLANEDRSIVVTYNGEIFNHRELRRELEARGHVFRTRTDTEVLVHGWESWGPAMLERLNGQFAFALWDRTTRALHLFRDRFGVCPLFYAMRDGDLVFGSEAKALFASGEIAAAPDFEGLAEAITLWGAMAPRSPFRDVRQLEPGGRACWRDGSLHTERWFTLAFPRVEEDPANAVETLGELMESAVALRMRADVPVGAYLSGGLDSSVTSALAARQRTSPLHTFSVTFDDPRFDESEHQRAVARFIGSEHVVQTIGRREIARVFPEVIRHVETPLVRTAPAPLFLLARLAREHGIHVVLTGEGADEGFLGYDLFKETALRRFCLRRPDSTRRPRLFDRLYPYLGHAGRGGEMWRRFFLDAGGPDDPLFSHLPRFLLSSRALEFLTPDVHNALARFDPLENLRATLPADFSRWSALGRAAWLEYTTLLAGHLLSSQGDRVAMAHAVEGRFPFLDPRVVAFAASLRDTRKLVGLHEKVILKRWARSLVPDSVTRRPKQPYRAPDVAALVGNDEEAWSIELLGEDALRRSGLFRPEAVRALLRRCREGRATSAREGQALVAIASTQLWHEEFFTERRPVRPLDFFTADVLESHTSGGSSREARIGWSA